MSRRTEDEEASVLLADLAAHGLHICELRPKPDASYLEGAGATEWAPLDTRRAASLLAKLLITTRERE